MRTKISLHFFINLLASSALFISVGNAKMIDLGSLSDSLSSVRGTPSDLGHLGGDFSEAYGVSSNGSVIVGIGSYVGDAFNVRHPFIYTGNPMTGLDFGGALDGRALGVSADGSIIVGYYGAAGVSSVALKYSRGIITPLGTIAGQATSAAYGVSADGSVIVGLSGSRAFRYEGTTMADIGTLGVGGISAIARAVSADGGVVVGESKIANGRTHAFRYTVGGGMFDLQTLGGEDSKAYGVSGDGSVIVGYSLMSGNSNYHAFKYTVGDGMVDMRTLGGSNSIAYGVSRDGSIIVGQSSIEGNAAYHAFKYQDGVMTDLGTLGGATSIALAVSADNNVIVGSSDTSSGPRHAFLIRLNSTTLVDVENTATAIANNAYQLNSIINLSESNLNFALDQDATLFGSNNLNVTVGTRYTKANPYSGISNSVSSPSSSGSVAAPSQVAATLKIAYRFNEHLRAGVFLDQAASNNMPDNYALTSTQPMVGIFTTLSQRQDNTGAQLRLAAAYNSADLNITRSTIANTEAGRGTSSLTSKGALIEASYGFKLTESLNLRPIAGMRATKVSRDSYVEDSGADFPIFYRNIEKKSTTGFAGLQLLSAVTKKLSLQTKLVIERDLYRSIDGYAGDVSYLGSFNIEAPHLKKNRGVASFGGVYKVAQDREVEFGAIYGQYGLNNGDVVTGYLSYGMGF